MTKKTILQEISTDWVHEIENKQKEEVIELISGFPDGCIFGLSEGYDASTGYIAFEREETDKEYVIRLKEEAKRDEAAAKKRKKQVADTKENLKTALERCKLQLEELPQAIKLLEEQIKLEAKK